MDQETQRQSLIAFYFGPTVATSRPETTEVVIAASHRAYRDLNRTLTGFGSYRDRESLRNEVHASISEFISTVGAVKTQEEFDKHHQDQCEKICKLFERVEISNHTFNFHPGQAQKWLNMTLKYLAVLDHPQVQRVYEYLHVPIDKFVYEAALKEGIKRPLPNPKSSTRSTAWSRLTYKQYWDYQQELRKLVGPTKEHATPLDWEAAVWVSRNNENPQTKGKAN